jgi:hypothetical protein
MLQRSITSRRLAGLTEVRKVLDSVATRMSTTVVGVCLKKRRRRGRRRGRPAPLAVVGVLGGSSSVAVGVAAVSTRGGGHTWRKQQRRGRRRGRLPPQQWASLEEAAASRSASRPCPLAVVDILGGSSSVVVGVAAGSPRSSGRPWRKQQRRGRRRGRVHSRWWTSLEEAAASRSASRPAPLAVVGVLGRSIIAIFITIITIVNDLPFAISSSLKALSIVTSVVIRG